MCKPRRRHQEFLSFLKHVAQSYPDRELCPVMDNYAAHKKQEVCNRLAENPCIRVHFTRTYIDGWKNRAHPFVWTKTADEILKKLTAKQLQREPLDLFRVAQQ